MGIMVIYLMDEGDKVEVSAEFIGEEGNAFKLGTNVMDGLMTLEGVSLTNEKGRISSSPASSSLN